MFAKKSLGQNFLNSPSALQAMIEAGRVEKGDTVLEIGPGRGVLTEAILATGAKIVAIEKDDQLFEFLQEKFATEIKNKKLILIHDDILTIPTHQNFFSKNLGGQAYKLIANIPYNITGQIIRKFLSGPTSQPTLMVLMLQKEVAKRMVADDKKPAKIFAPQKLKRAKESLLSISVKVFGEPKYIKTVPAGAFRPAPKVDSAILLIDKINCNNFKKNKIKEEKFFDILHRGFTQKRKLLASNLKITPTILVDCQIGEKARAENLTVKNWLCLAVKI